jgi:hypothetical protein
MKTKEMSKQQRPDTRLVTIFSSLIRRRTLLFMVAALMGCATLALAVNGYNTKAPDPVEVTASAAIAVAAVTPVQGFTQGQRPTSVREAFLITITPDHIQPAQLTSSEGFFIIAIENRSGLENLSLRMTSKEGLIHQTDMPLLKTMWTGEFHLSKGTYELRESSHPDWVCTITVE